MKKHLRRLNHIIIKYNSPDKQLFKEIFICSSAEIKSVLSWVRLVLSSSHPAQSRVIMLDGHENLIKRIY